MTNYTTRIVVIGGGFAGLNFIKQLAGKKQYEIVLVDRNNYNQFTPLVYQVATGFLDASNISYPFRKLFRSRNVRYHYGTFTGMDVKAKICYLDNGALHYDYLVFATGSVSNFFGNKNIEQNAIHLKTLNDALNMRDTLLQSLEAACNTDDVSERNKLLTIVIAGGGPTGVEVSGMLGELRKNAREKDYSELKGAGGDIYLVEGSNRLLTGMSQQSHEDALTALKKLKINVSLNTTVTDYDCKRVILSDGRMIETETLIWTAGVTAVAFNGIPSGSIGKGKRMLTDAYNRVLGVDDLYAIGDTCLQLTDERFPNGHPQLAQPAIQQGRHLAKNFMAMAKGKPIQPFRYWNKGTMAVIGRNKAVVDLAKPAWHFNGITALLIWLFIHIMGLLTNRNKIKTLVNWFITYATNDQSLRLIVRQNNDLKTITKKNNYEVQNEYQKS